MQQRAGEHWAQWVLRWQEALPSGTSQTPASERTWSIERVTFPCWWASDFKDWECRKPWLTLVRHERLHFHSHLTSRTVGELRALEVLRLVLQSAGCLVDHLKAVRSTSPWTEYLKMVFLNWLDQLCTHLSCWWLCEWHLCLQGTMTDLMEAALFSSINSVQHTEGVLSAQHEGNEWSVVISWPKP